MNRWTRKRKARGFTLVELLIVIVIIGILAGSMLLVFGSTTDKAKATRIVSDMRTLKAAALMYYADYGVWPTNIADNEGNSINTSFDNYMDRANYVGPEPEIYYNIVQGTSTSDVYVRVSGLQKYGEVSKRLADMAEESGIYKTAKVDKNNVYTRGGQYAFMAISQKTY